MPSEERIQGLIESGTVEEVLRSFANTPVSRGVLQIRAPLGEGTIWIDRHIIIAAHYGDFSDRKAVLHMLALSSGHYSFTPSDAIPVTSLGDSLASVLLECTKHLQEYSDPNTLFDFQKTPEGVSLKLSDAEEDLVLLPTEEEDPYTEPDEAPPVVRQSPEERRKATSPGLLRRLPLIIGAILIIGGGAFFISRAIKRSHSMRNDTKAQAAAEDQRQKHVNALLSSGNRLANDGQFEAALTNYVNALALSPGDEMLTGLVATTEERIALRDRELALIADAERERERQRQNSENTRKELEDLVTQGNTFRSRGDLESALLHYKKAQSLLPDDIGVKSLVETIESEIVKRSNDRKARDLAAEKQRRMRLRVAQKLKAADEKRRIGRLAEAESMYAEIDRIDPENASLESRRAKMAQHHMLLKRLGTFDHVASGEVTVSSSTVTTLQFANGEAIDLYVTARGGPVRIGRINEFGTPSELWFENSDVKSTTNGKISFSYLQNDYTVVWQKKAGARNMQEYVIAVGKSAKRDPLQATPPDSK